MALQARHRFIIKRVEDALLPGSEQLVEDLIRHDTILQRVNSLFSPEGIQSLIFTYYPPGSIDIPDIPQPAQTENDEKKEGGGGAGSGSNQHAGFEDLNSYAMAGDLEIGYLLGKYAKPLCLTLQSYLKYNFSVSVQ